MIIKKSCQKKIKEKLTKAQKKLSISYKFTHEIIKKKNKFIKDEKIIYINK